MTSATNQVSNAIPGLTLNLNNVGGAATVTVAPDQQAQGDQVNSFVGAYNTLIRDIAGNTQALPNKTAPPLAGDGALPRQRGNGDGGHDQSQRQPVRTSLIY